MQHKLTSNASPKPEIDTKNSACAGDVEQVWSNVYSAATKMLSEEKELRFMLEDVILKRESLGDSLAVRLSRKLAREDMQRDELEPMLSKIIKDHPEIVKHAAADMQAIVDRDPACESELEPLLFFKGFHAITSYRISHILWQDNRKGLAHYFQSITSEIFGVDIHPAAKIGCGILLDHATSFVVGETSIIENDVSILHEVTLGGTGKETGDRHPIVRSGVLIGAGAKILGRVEIGECAKIGAGSVVLNDVPPHVTVAGVPAEEVGQATEENPAFDMDQRLCGKKLSEIEDAANSI